MIRADPDFLAVLHPGRYQAMAILWEAHGAACESTRSHLDFACQITSLHALGVTDAALRWLVDKGLADHHLETTGSGKARTFKKSPNLRFTSASCFLLTSAGIAAARQSCLDPAHLLQKPHVGRFRSGCLPSWSQNERTLSVDKIVVKHFKVPATAQELILNAFEEENWPRHLDDPLPPLNGVDRKQRLHDTIKRLNRQKNALVHFAGDGLGKGILWRFQT